MKTLDLNQSIYELVNANPELKEIMAGLGFGEITKPGMLESVGKLMTLPKGAKMRGLDLGTIITTLQQNGFNVTGVLTAAAPEASDVQQSTSAAPVPETEKTVNPADSADSTAPETAEERLELLKSYLRRLGEGESMDTVRADFVAKFQSVDAAEIMHAEQELINAGTPINKVQKLCDIHSALFHGKTRQEQIANAEKAVNSSLARENRLQTTDKLVHTAGHPLETFTRENEALAGLIAQGKEAIAAGDVPQALVDSLRGLAIHYAKKGDLLYPVLKVRYGITGPSDVMWTVDDEIRDEFALLAKQTEHDTAWTDRFARVLQRAEEMIYKEEHILYPNCAVSFTLQEWVGIYHDAKAYALCLGVTPNVWRLAERAVNVVEGASEPGQEIVMAGGHMTVAQLTALLNTIPLEITFVDDNNINRFFNEGPKDFKRPGMAIDREVFSCHPPKVEEKVRAIFEAFRAGTMDEVPIWMEKNGKCMLVRYMAVRDKDHNYLGTVELVQNMDFAREHFEKLSQQN